MLGMRTSNGAVQLLGRAHDGDREGEQLAQRLRRGGARGQLAGDHLHQYPLHEERSGVIDWERAL